MPSTCWPTRPSFLTFLILFILYNYIVFIHKNSRFCDLHLISSKMSHSFTPHDNELGYNYLSHLYQIREINNNRIIVNHMHSRQLHLR